MRDEMQGMHWHATTPPMYASGDGSGDAAPPPKPQQTPRSARDKEMGKACEQEKLGPAGQTESEVAPAATPASAAASVAPPALARAPTPEPTVETCVVAIASGVVLKPIPCLTNRSGYKGVYQGRNGRWQAQVDHKVCVICIYIIHLKAAHLAWKCVLCLPVRRAQSIGGFSTAWDAGVAVAARLALRDYGIHAAVASAVQGPQDQASA